MSFLISDAIAQTGSAGAMSSPYSSIFLLVGFLVIFYFLFIRPQNKKAKEHRDLLSSLQQGDEVVTSGGIYGVISQLEDHALTLTIAKNVVVKIQRQAVIAAVPKGTVSIA